jgi:nitrilase
MTDSLPTVRAAAVQAEPAVLDRDATVEKACRLIAEAAEHGARLIVFPEVFIPTYINARVWGRGLANFGTIRSKRAWARLWRNAVEIPSRSTDALARAAREANAVVVMGLHERTSDSSTLYNTLLCIGPDGAIVGKHRKLMPTNHERMVWGMGDGSTLRVWDTPAGKIGGLICWENWMPLARYALYAQGEQIHVAPTADDRELSVLNIRHTAAEGRVFVVSVCMVLHKRSYPPDFELGEELAEAEDPLESGGSAIAGPDGELLAGPLWNEEGILYADLDLNRVVEERQLLDLAGHYARPDVLSLRFDSAAHKTIEVS